MPCCWGDGNWPSGSGTPAWGPAPPSPPPAGKPASRPPGGQIVGSASALRGGKRRPLSRCAGSRLRPCSLPRPARESLRSRGRSVRCRRHGCHHGSEVSLWATAAGAGSSIQGSPATPPEGSPTRRTADPLGLRDPRPSARARFLRD